MKTNGPIFLYQLVHPSLLITGGVGGVGGEVVRGDGDGGRWHESRLPHLNAISGTIWLARNDLEMQISPEYPLNEVVLVRWTP